ncbi:MAG TPA: hypothetical protein VL907_05685 [Pyrinomonadaceae bacterium]|jgi:hypothetical protein|nr:hypothetical protein [Pyrinomonadaceae bacterium]
MKEITRRLYKKPVMLAMLFLAGMAMLVGLFVTSNSKAALPIIQHGDDLFETTGNGETFHNFGNAPIKAGFFTSNSGSPSLAYDQSVALVGKALTDGSEIDTIISRNDDVNVPGTTSLTMTGLSLESITPLTITYANGTQENWKMQVGLSAFKSSTGSMTIGSGGTFDSTLKVWPKFTFTSQLDGDVKVLDTGAGSGLTAFSSAVAFDDREVGNEEPVPLPAPTIAPCPEVAQPTTEASATVVGVSDAAAASSCPPVTLTASNVPWQICPNGKFCIPRPLTEAELWASHNASPPGTKKRIIKVAQPVAIQ